MQNPDFYYAMPKFFGNQLDFLDCEGLSAYKCLLNIASHCESLRWLYVHQEIPKRHCERVGNLRESFIDEKDDDV